MPNRVSWTDRRLNVRRRVFFIVLLLCLSLMIAWFCCEAYLRLSNRMVPSPDVLRDRTLEYVQVSGAQHAFPLREQAVPSVLKDVTIRINEKGYRGPSFKAAKPPGTIRIMIYGGSSVFNANCPEEISWPRLVEQQLRESGYSGAEVINAGIPGHTSFDSVARYFAEGHQFDPDIVVLYNTWNDLKYHDMRIPALHSFIPYDPDVDLRLTYAGRLDRVLCRSRAYSLLRYHYLLRAYKIGHEGALIPPTPSRPAFSRPARLGDYAKSRGMGFSQFDLNLRTFVQCVRQSGARPVLMTQATLVHEELPLSERAKIRSEYVRASFDQTVRLFDRYSSLIREVAAELRVTLIDPSGTMNGKPRFFTDQVHLRRRGAARLAKFTSTQLFHLMKYWGY